MANKVTTLIDVNTQDELYPRTKASAVSDNDGNTLGNIAVWNALDVASGVNTVNVGLDMDLLWTNSAPTSSFSAQTIQLDLSGYALILITSENSVSFAENNVGSKSQITYSSTSGQIRHRDFTVVTTGITFDAGYGGSSTDNTNCRPYKIYGIR